MPRSRRSQRKEAAAHPRLVVAGLALALLIAACSAAASDGGVSTLSGSGADGSGDTSEAGEDSAESPEDTFLALAQCLRDKGLDVADPQFDGNGRPIFEAGGLRDLFDDPDAEQSLVDCRAETGFEFGPGRADDPRAQAERADQREAIAACLRDKGFDVPDPDTAGPGAMRDLFEDEDAATALQECAQESGFEPRGGPGAGPPPG